MSLRDKLFKTHIYFEIFKIISSYSGGSYIPRTFVFLFLALSIFLEQYFPVWKAKGMLQSCLGLDSLKSSLVSFFNIYDTEDIS